MTLAELDAYTGESSHGATKSVYGQDPDGNEFEVMWMLPKDSWGEYADAAPVEHLDLAAEVDRWTGVRTAGDLVPVDAPSPRSPARSSPGTAAPPPRHRSWCSSTAEGPTSATSSRSPRTCPRGRRTPPCAHRSPRAVGSPGSPTAASGARSHHPWPRPRRGSATGSTTPHLRDARSCSPGSVAVQRSRAVWCWPTQDGGHPCRGLDRCLLHVRHRASRYRLVVRRRRQHGTDWSRSGSALISALTKPLTAPNPKARL